MPSQSHFEARSLLGTAIRDLELTIAGTALEPLLVEFREELERAGIRRLKPLEAASFPQLLFRSLCGAPHAGFHIAHRSNGRVHEAKGKRFVQRCMAVQQSE